MKTQIPPRLKSSYEPFIYNNNLDNKSKSDFEIVVARYDEDINWCKNYKKFVTVYNKGKDNLSLQDVSCISLENKGHLADTILRHIINNYDNLSDVTFLHMVHLIIEVTK